MSYYSYLTTSQKIKYISGWIAVAAAVICGLWLLSLLFRMDCRTNEEVVSGIVYDASFDEIISGNTNFKIRAAAEMPTDEKTSSTYCLPKGSQYEELIREAAGDKNVKVKVTAHKFFEVKNAIWDCPETIEVERITGE